MKKTFFFFAALVAVAACKQVEISVPETEETFREVSIVASAIDTKTQLQDDNSVTWEQTDKIMLMFSPADDSDVAVRTSEFAFAETENEGVTAKFTGEIANTVTTDGGYSDDVFAVYPSTAMNESTGAVTWTIDAAQAVAPGSFPTDANLSSAKISLDELNANEVAGANFQNALSIIRFTLPEYVNSVKVTGTAPLTGEAILEFNNVGMLEPTLDPDPASVTVTPKGAAAFTAGETYNILVWPGEHTALTVNLTDVHGCTLSKTVSGDRSFVAGQFYTFNFKSDFTKTYSFTSTLVPEGENKVLAVFPAYEYTQELPYAEEKFSGVLKASMVHENATGYAVYPSSAYVDGNVSYTLDPVNGPAELQTAALSVDALVGADPEVNFNSIEDALATLKFTVPAGVKSVTIESTKGIAGAATIAVTEGLPSVSTEGSLKTFTLSEVTPNPYALAIYPVSGATLTVTLTDGTGATVVKTFENVTVNAGASHTLDLSGELNFDKDGSFGNEGFGDGLDGGEIEF